MSSEGILSDTTKRPDETKLKEFMGKVVNDLGATWSTVLVIIGDKLGLYKAMADSKPITAVELASRTGTTERYVREWLANQATGGYIIYDPNTEKYTFHQNKQWFWLMIRVLHLHLAVFFRDEPKITDAFSTGRGVDWGD